MAVRWHRESARLPAFDYSRSGAYFLTICTHRRVLLFERTEYIDVAAYEWTRSAELRSEIELDAFVVMPNHVHGVAWIASDRADPSGGSERAEAQADLATRNEHPSDPADRVGAQGLAPLRGSAFRVQPHSLGSFVRGYKSAVTASINALRGTPGAPVWQRNYYEHVIRGDADLERIRRYIEENPLRWAFDRENLAGRADAAETDFWDSLS